MKNNPPEIFRRMSFDGVSLYEDQHGKKAH